MDKKCFINIVVDRCRNVAIESMILNLKKPAGRKPNPKLVNMSEWYNKLSEIDKVILEEVIQESVDEALFGLMCVLDGSRSSGVKGNYLISYQEGYQKVTTNNGDEPLHDLYILATT